MQKEAALFKALSDPTRLRLAVLLASHGETCVCDLAVAIGEPDFKVSRHLGILRFSGLVEARREGTWMYYRLSESHKRLESWLQKCFRDCLSAEQDAQEDLAQLETAISKRTGKSVESREVRKKSRAR